ATATALTISGNAWLTALTNSLLATDQNGKIVATSSLFTLTPTSPLTGGSTTALGNSLSIGCQNASTSQAGCLSVANFNLFNGKLATGTAVTLGQLAVFGGPSNAPTIYSAPTTTA